MARVFVFFIRGANKNASFESKQKLVSRAQSCVQKLAPKTTTTPIKKTSPANAGDARVSMQGTYGTRTFLNILF